MFCIKPFLTTLRLPASVPTHRLPRLSSNKKTTRLSGRPGVLLTLKRVKELPSNRTSPLRVPSQR